VRGYRAGGAVDFKQRCVKRATRRAIRAE
jgi:hypothetical protein